MVASDQRPAFGAPAIAAILALIAIWAASNARAATISVYPYSFVQSRGAVPSIDGLLEVVRETALTEIPSSDNVSARKGANIANANFALTNESILISTELSRTNRPGALADGTLDVFFRSASDVTFQLSGSMQITDPDGSETIFEVVLTDRDTGASVFFSSQHSTATPNEAFVLGAGGGDQDDLVTGALTGILKAGRLYEFIVYQAIIADPDAISTASSTGSVTLAFVPEPGPALLVGLGLMAMASHDRRPRKANETLGSPR